MEWVSTGRRPQWPDAFMQFGIGMLLICHTGLGQPIIDTVTLAKLTVLDEYGKRQSIRLQPNIDLKARQNYLAFAFKSRQPAPIQYRLDGVDNEWIDARSVDQIQYTNLSGGTYAFRFRQPVTGYSQQIYIRIDTPFWNRWWFGPALFLYVLGVIGLVFYLFLQYRFRQQLRFYQARDRIARDLHDDMGSYLSSISILSQNAHRSATKDPVKTQATLDRIGQTARQVMGSMSDIVWSINPDHDSMAQVVARMTDVASSLFAGGTDQLGNVAPEIDVADDVRQLSLSAESRRDFFLIYKEAITNVARYAHASRVRVMLRREGNLLLLTVQDDGQGFDPKNPPRLNSSGGNGLRNMQARAALLGGILAVESVAGQGTTVTLRFPV